MDINSIMQNIFENQSLLEKVTAMFDYVDPATMKQVPELGKAKDGVLITITFVSKEGGADKIKEALEAVDSVLRNVPKDMKTEPKKMDMTDVFDMARDSGIELSPAAIMTIMSGVTPLLTNKELRNRIAAVKGKVTGIRTGIQIQGNLIKYKVFLVSSQDIFADTNYVVNELYKAFTNVMKSLSEMLQ